MIAAMSTVRLWRIPTPSASPPASSRTRAGLLRVGSTGLSSGSLGRRILRRGWARVTLAKTLRFGDAIDYFYGGRPHGRGTANGKQEPAGAAEAAADRLADGRGFRHRRWACTGPGRGRGAGARDLSLARPLYARPHQWGALLRQAGRCRRGYRGPRRGTGRPLARPGLPRG